MLKFRIFKYSMARIENTEFVRLYTLELYIRLYTLFVKISFAQLASFDYEVCYVLEVVSLCADNLQWSVNGLNPPDVASYCIIQLSRILSLFICFLDFFSCSIYFVSLFLYSFCRQVETVRLHLQSQASLRLLTG